MDMLVLKNVNVYRHQYRIYTYRIINEIPRVVRVGKVMHQNSSLCNAPRTPPGQGYTDITAEPLVTADRSDPFLWLNIVTEFYWHTHHLSDEWLSFYMVMTRINDIYLFLLLVFSVAITQIKLCLRFLVFYFVLLL